MSSLSIRLAIYSLWVACFTLPTYAMNTNYVRFIAGHDLIRTLRKTFPYGVSYSWDSCNQIEATQKDSLGQPSVLTGRPNASKPGPVYFQWWKTCIEKHSKEQMRAAFADTRGTKPSAFQEVVPETWRDRFREMDWSFRQKTWSQSEPALRNAALHHWFRKLGGYAITTDRNAWVDKMDRRLLKDHGTVSFEQIYPVVALSILTHEKFLTY